MISETVLRVTVREPAVASCDVTVGDGTIARLGAAAAGALRPSRCAVVTDENVARTPYVVAAETSLAAAGFRPFRVVLPAGEAAKTLAVAERTWSEFAAAGLDRAGCVVAVGGGATGDAAAFCAALWMRGVPVVQVPTTLLAMADSAVGGKTAVNLREGKNLVGVVRQPALVVADVSTLRTLPRRELASGFAEILKCAVLEDPSRIATMRRDAARLLAVEPELAADAVAFAVRVKAAHVADDPDDTLGRRALLNLGHTTAHALESVTGYGTMLHGEAVAAGLVVAARIGARRGTCGAALADELAAALTAFGLPTGVPHGVRAADVVAATRLDKKRADGVRKMVLPGASAGTACVAPVSDEELLAALA